MNRAGNKSYWFMALLLAVSATGAHTAWASPVDIGSSSFNDNIIVLPSSALVVTDFLAEVTGTVTLTVTDLHLGDLLSTLSTSITLFDGRRLQLEGSKTAVFDIGANQRFTTSIYALSTGAKGFGVYNLDVAFKARVSEVPLPLGGLLLLTGCGLLSTRIRRTRLAADPVCA
jgi:hypothetical protein